MLRILPEWDLGIGSGWRCVSGGSWSMGVERLSPIPFVDGRGTWGGHRYERSGQGIATSNGAIGREPNGAHRWPY